MIKPQTSATYDSPIPIGPIIQKAQLHGETLYRDQLLAYLHNGNSAKTTNEERQDWTSTDLLAALIHFRRCAF